jgi:hypothetical protein
MPKVDMTWTADMTTTTVDVTTTWTVMDDANNMGNNDDDDKHDECNDDDKHNECNDDDKHNDKGMGNDDDEDHRPGVPPFFLLFSTAPLTPPSPPFCISQFSSLPSCHSPSWSPAIFFCLLYLLYLLYFRK